MNKYVFLSFVFMGWAFYELSGGADFKPMKKPEQLAAQNQTGSQTPVNEDTTVIKVTGGDVAGVRDQSDEQIVTAISKTPVVPNTDDPVPAVMAATEKAEMPIEPAVLSMALLEAAPQTNSLDLTEDIRTIKGAEASVRRGPGINYAVVTRLIGGTKVEVLHDPGDGWLKMRLVGGVTTGWIDETQIRDGRN